MSKFPTQSPILEVESIAIDHSVWDTKLLDKLGIEGETSTAGHQMVVAAVPATPMLSVSLTPTSTTCS